MDSPSHTSREHPRYIIHFPKSVQGLNQDAEYCSIEYEGKMKRIRLHDYHKIYSYPGLYEQLFYEELKCTSPRQVCGLLEQVLGEHHATPAALRAIDLGAGNGMVGEQLHELGVRDIVGVDIIPEAKTAAYRDRPDVYLDYLVADLTNLDHEHQERLRKVKATLLITVAALGFGDIPPKAFATAFNMIQKQGWIAFNIRDTFLTRDQDQSGFSRLINAMMSEEIIRMEAWKRYVHRVTIEQEPIEYIALVARKLKDIPDDMVTEAQKHKRVTVAANPAPVASDIHLAYHQVSKRYEGASEPALHDFNLQIPRGEILALVGGSGSGKTTALKLINRLIEPTEGQVLINGKPVQYENPVELRRRIGYVFQQAGLFPHWTVGENIATIPRLLGWTAAEIAMRVDELLDLVGLDAPTYRLRRVRELSGGQQQRVGFARALAVHPSMLLLDEPFAALDPLIREQLQEEFLRIQQRMKFTCVWVTHDMAEALLLAHRIAVLHLGRLIQVGTPGELLERPADDHVRQLLNTPLRQAARVDELMTTGSSTGALLHP